jgi:hypothetical protein
MSGESRQERVVAFVPALSRYVVIESWAGALGIAVGGILLNSFSSFDWWWVAVTVGVGLLAAGFGATVQRQSRRLVFGDTWLSGPTRGSSESTTIPYSTIDHARSGFRKGRFVVQSTGTQQISARLAWYSRESVEELERVARERCSLMALPARYQ